MSNTRQALLPLDELDPSQFEAFVLHFLGAKISLAVIEKVKTPSGEVSQHARHGIISATLFGNAGPAGQLGIDIKAVTETGAEWVFQCKHYGSPFPLSKATAAVEKAEKEYPKAARYFLMLSGEPTPPVRAFVEGRPHWEIWGRSELSIRFYNEVEPRKQLEILRRFFPRSSDALIAQLYPQHDDPLITTEQFFKRWNEPGRVFNHRAGLVGREEELKALHAFADDPELRVLILPAPGGVGKTRLLRAFGEEFPGRHSGKKIYFFDPMARPGLPSDILRTAGDGELVAVQDDAHRSESLRPDLAAALFEKNGKLVLSTRPHAVDSLAAWLSLSGIDASAIRVLPALAGLTREQLVTLARSCLPPKHHHAAESLADLAKGCSLIVTVASALIAQDKLTATGYVNSTDFQHAVFTRFEAEGFAQVAASHNAALVRETLRMVAVLAPWTPKVLELDAVAGLLDCSVREFQEAFDLLRAAGLLIETREGWRVVPDLFADYLVYRGCYDDAGRLTEFAKRLQKHLLGSANGIILRNLAEAEWQAKLKGQQIESLLDPFWQDLRTKFVQVDFWSRAELVRQWKQFAVLQPERSLELVQLAISLDTAPPMAVPKGFARSPNLETHERVLAELPALLEPIATYHEDFRKAALNLLWALHRKVGRINDNAQNDPLATIGRVAKYQARHPITAPLGVVDWLGEQLAGPHAAEFCDRNLPVLSVILKPVFERDVEDNFSTGRMFTFRTLPLSVTNTRKIRERALKLLTDLVIPRGELATLNALSVLDAAIDIVRLRWKNVPAGELQEEWLPERRAALEIIAGLIRPNQSVRVLFRIRKILRLHAARDLDEVFKAECARVLALVPESEELQLTTLLLSGEWAEFFHDVPHVEETPKEARPRVETMWAELCESVTKALLRECPTASALISRATRLVQDHENAGMPAQFDALFRTIARLNQPVATEMVDLILAGASSTLDRWWVALFAGWHKLPDPKLRGWIQSVLRGDNPVRWQPILFALRWAGIGEVTAVEMAEVHAWARRLTDDTLTYAIEHLRMRFTDDHATGDAILANLELASFSAASLESLARVLERSSSVQEVPLPPGVAENFIAQLQRVDRIDWHGAESFLHYLAEIEPVRFYEMLKQRVLQAAQRREEIDGYLPLPYGAFTLDKLPEAEGYPQIAEDLYRRYRESDAKSHYLWRMLFQIAVLRVSPLGMEFMEKWLPEIKESEELLNFVETMHFDGSMVIFWKPELVRAILRKALAVAPEKFGEISWYLGNTASPKMRGYTDHVLDPEQRYYREEAAKAAAVFAADPELSAFYRDIVRREDDDAARHHREAELDLVEW
jgi:hypothetical protein